MKVISTTAALRAELAAERQQGRRIGFVPTMGWLHDGHLSLIRRARAETEIVVVSIFVNPRQFNDPNDLLRYPRDLDRDARLAESVHADIVFAPEVEDIYPDGYATVVSIPGLSATLEGAVRGPSHFDGVLTVVAKLFNIVQPTVAYFGQKDAQQVFLVQRMVRDLASPLRIEVCPTIRDPDGLAMSSRNARLDAGERTEALALSAALRAGETLVAGGERDAAAVTGAVSQRLHELGIAPEYCAIVSAASFEPVATVAGTVTILIAARVGPVRLIDNVMVSAP